MGKECSVQRPTFALKLEGVRGGYGAILLGKGTPPGTKSIFIARLREGESPRKGIRVQKAQAHCKPGR